MKRLTTLAKVVTVRLAPLGMAYCFWLACGLPLSLLSQVCLKMILNQAVTFQLFLSIGLNELAIFECSSKAAVSGLHNVSAV